MNPENFYVVNSGGMGFSETLIIQSKLSTTWGFSQEDIKDEPRLINATPREVFRDGGPISRTFFLGVIPFIDNGLNLKVSDYFLSCQSRYLHFGESWSAKSTTLNIDELSRFESLRYPSDFIAFIGPSLSLFSYTAVKDVSIPHGMTDIQMDTLMKEKIDEFRQYEMPRQLDSGVIALGSSPVIMTYEKCISSGYYYVVRLSDCERQCESPPE